MPTGIRVSGTCGRKTGAAVKFAAGGIAQPDWPVRCFDVFTNGNQSDTSMLRS